MKKMIPCYALSLCFLLMILIPITASAHTDNSEGYSKISMDRENEKLHVELYIDYFEMGRLIDYGVIPGAPAAQLSKTLEEKREALTDYLSSHFEVLLDGEKV